MSGKNGGFFPSFWQQIAAYTKKVGMTVENFRFFLNKGGNPIRPLTGFEEKGIKPPEAWPVFKAPDQGLFSFSAKGVVSPRPE